MAMIKKFYNIELCIETLDFFSINAKKSRKQKKKEQDTCVPKP
jgi:hypothetical protein